MTHFLLFDSCIIDWSRVRHTFGLQCLKNTPDPEVSRLLRVLPPVLPLGVACWDDVPRVMRALSANATANKRLDTLCNFSYASLPTRAGKNRPVCR